jgi:hypothetical protein
VLALLASLTFTLSPTMQAEATVAGGSTLAIALALGAVSLAFAEIPSDRELETRRRVAQGLVFGVLLTESPTAAAAVALATAGHAVLTRQKPTAPALLPLLGGLALPLGLAALGLLLRPLAPSLWVDVGRGLSFGGLAPLDVEALRVRALSSWATDVGIFPLLTGTVGAGLVLLRPKLRPLGVPLLLFALPDLLVPATRASVLSVDPLAPLRGLAVATFAMLGAVAMQTGLQLLEQSRLPFARAVAVLLVAFSAAILAIASEEATLRVDRSAARSVEVFTDEALERLPNRAVVLVRSDATAYRLWAARLVRGQRPDVTVIPVPLLTRGRVAQRALAEEPACAPLLRDLSARGAPSEYALSTLSDARPLFVELDPTWDRALASHTTPEHLWLRFASQPLGPSDRKAGQQAQDTSRTRVRGAATSGDEEHGGYPDLSSEGTLEVLSTRAREEVAVAAFVGDTESARRSLAALAELRENDAFATAARTRMATARRGLDLRGMLRSGKLDHPYLHVVQTAQEDLMHVRPAAAKLAAVFALVTLVPFATGCSKSPKDKLQGKWVGDKVDNVPLDQEARATGWVKGTTFEFKGDKVIVTIPAEEPRTGTFNVAGVNGNKLNVAFTRANGDIDEATFTLAAEGKAIKWDIGNDRTVTLARSL